MTVRPEWQHIPKLWQGEERPRTNTTARVDQSCLVQNRRRREEALQAVISRPGVPQEATTEKLLVAGGDGARDLRELALRIYVLDIQILRGSYYWHYSHTSRGCVTREGGQSEGIIG